MTRHHARETVSLEQARGEIDVAQATFDKILRQLSAFWSPPHEPRMLDIGCAQGLTLLAASQRGFHAVGVEPWAAARDVAQEPCDATNLSRYRSSKGSPRTFRLPRSHSTWCTPLR